MKTAWLILSAVLVSTGFAQQRDLSVHPAMRVEQVGGVYEVARSSLGLWVTRDWANARVGFASVRYTGQRPMPVTLRFVFVGRSRDGLTIYHYDAQDATLQPGQTTKATTLSPVIVQSRTSTRDADFGRAFSRVSGVVPFGWAMLVMRNGARVAWTSSTPEMIERVDKLILETGPERLAELAQEATERRKN